MKGPYCWGFVFMGFFVFLSRAEIYDRFLDCFGLCLLVLEKFALDQRVHDGANTIFTGLGALKNLLNLASITKPNRRTRGEHRQLPREISRYLRLVPQQQVLEITNVLKRTSVSDHTAGIDRQSKMKGEGPAILPETREGGRIHRRGAVTIAPGAHHIEIFQRESRRINLLVAQGTAFVGPMLVELLAYGNSAANVRLDRGDSRRWWWHVEPDNPFHDPFATKHR